MLNHGVFCKCVLCEVSPYETLAPIRGVPVVQEWYDSNASRKKEEVMSDDNATDATKALKRALKARKVFPEGTVIRWISSGRYMYVAVFVNDQWYTTSANGYIAKVMDTETLTQTLARSDSSDIEVAATWNTVSN